MASSPGYEVTETTLEDLRTVRPEKPLPDELRAMEREETVCQYCGVSYLVFSEMKAMERRMKAAEEGLQAYKDAPTPEETAARLAEMQDSLQAARASADSCRKQLDLQEKQWLRKMSEAAAEASATLQRERAAWRAKSDTRASSAEKRVKALADGLRHARSALRRERSVMKDIRADASAVAGDIRSLMDSVGSEVGVLEHRLAREVKRSAQLAEQVASLTDSCDAERSAAARLEAQMGRLRGELQLLKDKRDGEAGELRAAKLHSERRNEALATEVSDVKAQLAKSSERCRALEEELRNESSKAERAHTALDTTRGQLAQAEVELRSTSRALAAAEEEVQAAARKHAILAKALSDREADMAAASADQSQLSAELRQLRGQLRQAQAAADEADAALQRERAEWTAELRSSKAAFERDLAAAMAGREDEAALRSAHAEQVDALTARHVAERARMREELEREAAAAKKAADMADTCAKRDKAAVAELQRAVQASAHARDQLQRKVDSMRGERDEQVLQAATLRTELGDVRRRLAELEARPAVVAAPAEELEELNRSLIAMTSKLRDRDVRIQHLEMTVHKECEERIQLMMKIDHLYDRLVAYEPGAAAERAR